MYNQVMLLVCVQEDEVLDMLAQYEAEENSGEGRFRKPKGPPPLTGMPCSSATEANQATSDGMH